MRPIAAVEERALAVGESGIEGDEEERRAAGGPEDFPRRIALVVARGIVERAVSVNVGLLGAHAEDEFQAIVEEGEVVAPKCRRDGLIHNFRGVGSVGVVGVGVAGPMAGVGLVVGPEFHVVQMLLLGQAPGGDALGVGPIEEGERAVVVGLAVLFERRGTRNAVVADPSVGLGADSAGVSCAGAHVGAEFHGHSGVADREVAAHVNVGLARDILRELARARRARD